MSTSMIRSFPTLAIVLCLVIAGCHPSTGDDPTAATAALEQALAPKQVELVQPELREEQPTLELVGEIRAFETAALSTEVVGNVDQVLVEVGDRVEQGQPLVEVDRDTFRLRLAQAEANLAAVRAELELAVKELERKQDLLSDRTIARAVYDQAEAAHSLAIARVGAAEATRDLARRDLERSVIKAPADGTVAKRLTTAGQWADINLPLIELAIGDEVKVAARVPEVWMPNLAGLDGFDFTVGTSSDSHHAKLFSIEPVVSQASRSFEVVGTFVVKGSMVRPGMFANIHLTSPTVKTSLWLPIGAVSTSDMAQVMMVENDVIVTRPIKTGRRDATMREIVTGLEPHDSVISNVAGLARGLPVKVGSDAGSHD